MVDTIVLTTLPSIRFWALERSLRPILISMMSLELRSETSDTCGETVGLQMARGVGCTAIITSSTTSLGTPSIPRIEQPQTLMDM
jgi:hypothetical protein